MPCRGFRFKKKCKLVAALVCQTLLLICGYVMEVKLYAVTSQTSDDTPTIISMIFQVFAIVVTIVLLFKCCADRYNNYKMLASIALILSLSALINDVLAIGFHNGRIGNLGEVSWDHDHHEINVEGWLTAFTYVGLVLRILNNALWWSIVDWSIGGHYVASILHHICMALIASKTCLLLDIFIIDLDWAFCMTEATEIEQIEHCEHAMHHYAEKVEKALVAFCAFEFIYFLTSGIKEGGWAVKSPLLVLLVAVITLDIYCLISHTQNHHIFTVARSLTFIEVIAATIDVSNTLRHLEEGSTGEHHNHDHQSHETNHHSVAIE